MRGARLGHIWTNGWGRKLDPGTFVILRCSQVTQDQIPWQRPQEPLGQLSGT